MGLVVLTSAPQILWREVLGRSTDPKWFLRVPFAIPVALLSSALLWRPLRSVSGFCLVLIVQAAGYWLAHLIVTKRLVAKLAPNARALQGLSSSGAYKVIPVVLMLPALVVLGYGGRLLLSAGDLSAPVRIFSDGPSISWKQMFYLTVVCTVAFLVIYARRVRPAQPVDLGNVVRFAPIIILAAVVNAFAEEFIYRNALLPFLVPLLGSGQAIWLTSLRFGIVHFYGTPSGILGVAAATLFGLVLGLSMVQTGGSGFAWTVHFIADLVIFGAAAAMWQPRAALEETEAAGARNEENVELG